MIRRWFVVTLFVLVVAASSSLARAQELTTDAERSWRELRGSEDVKRKLMAERWYSAIRQQDWSNDTGKFKTSAKYVAHDPQLAWVKLRVIQGAGDKRVVKDVQIPLERLSKACQARVRQIARLSDKITEAIEAEKNAAEEDEADGNAAGGALDETMDESRGGRGGMEAGLAGMDAEQVTAEGEAPPAGGRGTMAAEGPRVTNDGPPLPALIPRLPQLQPTTLPAMPAAPSEAPAAEAPAEKSAAWPFAEVDGKC